MSHENTIEAELRISSIESPDAPQCESSSPAPSSEENETERTPEVALVPPPVQVSFTLFNNDRPNEEPKLGEMFSMPLDGLTIKSLRKRIATQLRDASNAPPFE